MKITGSYVDHASSKTQSHSVELVKEDLVVLQEVLNVALKNCNIKAVEAYLMHMVVEIGRMLEDY